MHLQMQIPSPTRPLTSVKRKLTMRQSPASRILQRELRNNTSGLHSKRLSNSSSLAETQQGKKIVSDLLKQLNVEIQKRQKVEDELRQWKQRLVRKEMEFRQIIAKYESEKVVMSYPVLQTLHGDIQQKIEESNEQAEKWLEGKFKENLGLMERRISQIRGKMEEEMNKHKKLSVDSYNDIMMEVEHTKNLAKNIDEENRRLTKEIREVKFKNQLLAEERNMLIQEVVEKKGMINRLINEKNELRLTMKDNTFSRFIGEPSLNSPKRNSHSTSHRADSSRVTQSEKQSIQYLQKSLYRQRKKNFELSTLFTRSSKKNEELNSVLWDCINQAKKELGDSPDQTFASKLVENLVKSERLIKAINEYRDIERPFTSGSKMQFNSRLDDILENKELFT